MPIACQGMLVDTLVLVKIIVTKSYIQLKKRNFFVGKQMLKNGFYYINAIFCFVMRCINGEMK